MVISVAFRDGTVKVYDNVKHFKAERNFSIVFNNTRNESNHTKQFPVKMIEEVEVLDFGNPVSYYDSLALNRKTKMVRYVVKENGVRIAGFFIKDKAEKYVAKLEYECLNQDEPFKPNLTIEEEVL